MARMRLAQSTGSTGSWPASPSKGRGNSKQLKNDSEFQRSFSAGDILGMQRTPVRRPFDHPHPSKDGFGGNGKMVTTSLMPLGADVDDFGESDDGSVIPGESPGTRAIRERAIDYWKLGDSMRISHHIEPKTYRQISLYGEVFQGFYNHDWHNVEHIKAVRAKCPTARKLNMPICGPFPQGEDQEMNNRNRNYAGSHGSPKLTGGLMRQGGLLMVP